MLADKGGCGRERRGRVSLEEKSMANAQLRLQNLYAAWARFRMGMDEIELEIAILEEDIDWILRAEEAQRREEEKQNGS